VFDGIPRPNTFSHNALLSAHARLGRPADARALFAAIPDPDQCSYNAVIAALAQHGRGADALLFAAAMHAHDFVLNAYSFASALSACAVEKDPKTGRQLHALVSKSPAHGNDVYIGSALLDMYAKCECPEAAREGLRRDAGAQHRFLEQSHHLLRAERPCGRGARTVCQHDGRRFRAR
jgi:pentatricopeptide repeat protein